MATTLWGNVYYKDIYVGRLQETPDRHYIFNYDTSYIDAGHPAIAYSLPIRPEPYISIQGLHPFFDNLVAEGWLSAIQARALGINPVNRFGLLLGFGYDLAGAVSIIDPTSPEHKPLNHEDDATLAASLGSSSLSGVHRKLLVVKDKKIYRPVKANELSTHIAKLASSTLPHLIELEFLTTLAVKTLLPHDEVVELEIDHISAINENALVVKRFDRTTTGKHSYHFEEFNQLLGHYSEEKYKGSYADMANFMRSLPYGMSNEIFYLFQRILACLLVSNTDAHFKNFAMFHSNKGFHLTPIYDLVAAAMYNYPNIALKMAKQENLRINKLLPKHIVWLGEELGISSAEIIDAVETLGKRLPLALDAISKAEQIPKKIREDFINIMERRWNGSFSSIGHFLSKKQNSDVKKIK
jgi:serine/threonine-protein kinase HipA